MQTSVLAWILWFRQAIEQVELIAKTRSSEQKARQVRVEFPAKRRYYRSNTLHDAMGARIGSTGSYVGTQQGVGGGAGVSRGLANHCVPLVVTQLCPGSPQRCSSVNTPALGSAFVLTEHF